MARKHQKLIGTLSLGTLALALGGLRLYSSRQVAKTAAEFPPAGRFVTVEGTRLHYVCEGSGSPVVLLHGNGGSSWDYTMTMLDRVAKEYCAYVFDRPGHGYSGRPENEAVTPEVQARLLHGALSELGVEEPLLVGHSWGGALALSYALQYPNSVSGLVLLAPVAYADEDFNSAVDIILRSPVLGEFIRHTVGIPLGRRFVDQNLLQAFSPDPVPEDYRRAAKGLWTRPDQLKSIASDNITIGPALRRMSGRYDELKQPLTIVTGDSEAIIDPDRHARPLHKAVADSELVVLERAGHDLPHTRAGEVMDAIRRTSELAGK